MSTFLITLTNSGHVLTTLNLPFMPSVGDTIRVVRKPTKTVRSEDDGSYPTYNYFFKVIWLEHIVHNKTHTSSLAAVEFEDNDGFIPEEWGI